MSTKPGEDHGLLVCPCGYEDVYVVYHPNESTMKEYLRSWVEMVEQEAGYYDCIVVSHSEPSQDTDTAAALYELLRSVHGQKVSIVHPWSIRELIEVVASSRKVLSGRMHPLVIAKSLGRSVGVYRVSQKMASFELDDMYEDRENARRQIMDVFGAILGRKQ